MSYRKGTVFSLVNSTGLHREANWLALYQQTDTTQNKDELSVPVGPRHQWFRKRWSDWASQLFNSGNNRRNSVLSPCRYLGRCAYFLPSLLLLDALVGPA